MREPKATVLNDLNDLHVAQPNVKAQLPALRRGGLLGILPRMKKPTMRIWGGGSEHRRVQANFVAWYNFGRKHEALKNTTPAMASKLTDHVWTIKELIERAASA
jgi:hypothetical protein